MPNAGSPLLGDWFRCKDASCAELYATGIRYAANGNVYYLYAYLSHVDTEPPFTPGDPYCIPTDNRAVASWTYDPETELLERKELNSSPMRVTFTLDGADRGSMDGMPQARVDNATGVWDAMTYSCSTRY